MADRTAAGKGGAAEAQAAGKGVRTTTPGWTLHREQPSDAARDKVTQVKRYFKGQAPSGAEDEEEEEERPAVHAGPAALAGRLPGHAAPPRPPPAAPVVLAAREVRAPEVVARQPAAAAAAAAEEVLDDAEIDRRRAAARARALQLREAEVPEWQGAGEAA